MAEAVERRILICAPVGKDAELAANVLNHAGLACLTCRTFPDLMQELGKGAAAILTVEEALSPAASAALRQYIAGQATWSDLPILVLTKHGDSPWIKDAYDQFGNLTLLERPIRASALISSVRAALRARLRQYEIRAADQRKDEFLAMLGHELRNPLAPIAAAAQLLEIVPSDAAKVRHTAQIITRQIGHLTSLIDDLLDVARVTRGLIVLAKDALDFRQILSDAIEQVTPQITARQHHLALYLPPHPAIVVGDYKRLVQVIANLLTNASKYTPEGGNIVVRLQVGADEVALDISDNGVGMAPDLVSRVFDLFTQAKRTSDRSQGGLGLGLALVKNLVESHGGSVHAQSQGQGKGSTFSVRLPRRVSNAAATPDLHALNERDSGAVQSLRIMVVDDNADAAGTLAMLLMAKGHSVCIEHTARGAIEQARRSLPQVCLLDIGLPDMDGRQLAQRLRHMPETATALLIAVTGYGQEQDRRDALAAGFDHHLVKPVDATKLTALLGDFRAP